MVPPNTTGNSPVESSSRDPHCHERLDLDELLLTLAHPRRRQILALLDATPAWTTAELADRLANRSPHDTPPASSDVALSLRHQHLPKLVEAGLIAVDETGQRVERGPTYEPGRRIIEVAREVTA